MFPWFALMHLAFEAYEVIGLRILQAVEDGNLGGLEANLIISEKLEAFAETIAEIAAGATVYGIIEHYRERVAANAARLRAC